MYRRALTALQAWKDDAARKPLLLRGARQVGKSWLLQEFGERAYERMAYVNCQRDRSVAAVFEGDLDPDRLLRGIEAITGVQIEPGSTLVVIDEVQDVPAALTSLKYFAEQRSDVHLAAAGSLLGVALRANASFPVGKVAFIDLHPLDFDEFLRGVGDGLLADAIDSQDWGLLTALRDRLIERLREYSVIGGMPEAVARFADGASFGEVRGVQQGILLGYQNDFGKYASGAESRRVAEVWASIPSQLARENRRFILGQVRDGARAREFEGAIQWLEDAGLVWRVTRCEKPGSPVRAYEDRRIFKLFMHDVGLLAAHAGLDPAVAIDGARLFEEFKGALAEQYVLQEMVAATDVAPMYWARGADSSQAEVDFLVERSGELIPVEVKAQENLRSKSLSSYIARYAPGRAWRFSLADHREQADLANIPLYAIGPTLRDPAIVQSITADADRQMGR